MRIRVVQCEDVVTYCRRRLNCTVNSGSAGRASCKRFTCSCEGSRDNRDIKNLRRTENVHTLKDASSGRGRFGNGLSDDECTRNRAGDRMRYARRRRTECGLQELTDELRTSNGINQNLRPFLSRLLVAESEDITVSGVILSGFKFRLESSLSIMRNPNSSGYRCSRRAFFTDTDML